MTKILGHAGAASVAPPNTLEAFREAIAQGADGTELDVQLTADSQVVCIHDERLERLTDGTGWVKDHTYEQLSQLDASRSQPGFAPTRIPLLADVLELMGRAGLEVNVELKTGVVLYPGLEQKVLDVVAASGIADRVYYSSFNHYSLLEIRRLSPTAPIAPLYSAGLVEPWAYVERLGATGVHPLYLNLTQAEHLGTGLDPIAEFHSRGIAVRPWTVDDPEALDWLFRHGVDAVITNSPAAARRVLEQTPAARTTSEQTTTDQAPTKAPR